MSLKAFHVVFLVLSILLCLGVGVWGIQDYRSQGTVFHLVLGIGSIQAALLLGWYMSWFLRKLKGWSYL